MYILDNMVKNLEEGVKFYMFPRFIQVFVNHQLGDMSHHKGIFVNPSLTKKRKHKPKRKQREATKFPHTEPQAKERVPTPSNDPLPSGEDRMQLTKLMNLCTNLQKHVLDLEKAKTAQANEIADLKKRVKKLERKKKSRTSGLKRLYKIDLSTRIVSSDEKGLGDQEDASKQGRIAEIDADEDLSLINETAQDQGRMNDQDLFRVHDLDSDEVFVDVTIAKPKANEVTIQEPSEFRTTSPSQPPQAKDIEIVEESLRKSQVKVTEGSSKRAREEIEQESAKKQKLDEQVQAKVADDDTT
nr:hypothetical protein [Tanacetum cinerariifolium]